MDRKGKQVSGSSSSSSSFTTDLFGPKDSSKSSTGYFESIFGPPSKGPVRDTTRPEFEHSYYAKQNTTADINNTRKGQSMKNDKKNHNYENERSVEPCYYSSSIYYGGQENYTHTSHNISPPHNFEKYGENDEDESNSKGASRGNWWKGSLYY